MTDNKNIFEFPEDKEVVHLKLSDYDTHFTENGGSTRSSRTNVHSPESQPICVRFYASVFGLVLFAVSLMFCSGIRSIAGSILCIIILFVFHEWNRLYGMVLTKTPRASINYASVLREQKEFIPMYNLEWLFGKRYEPYYFGCTGPAINGDNCRTPDNEESHSPVKKRSSNDILRKKP
ncbi:unnamed protein product [Caenorhabditis angaria]|uniref:SAYSvFN domain-containing protein n=1 Tax=Caenorhabditis angaria TaxID=860376 RepID=A0A9P1IQ66_9PELO|nr:unnamed protein product [Caenorhabditis angaria]